MKRLIANGIAISVGIVCSLALCGISTLPPFPPNFGIMVFNPSYPNPCPQRMSSVIQGVSIVTFTFNCTEARAWGEVFLTVDNVGTGGLAAESYNWSVSAPILFNSLWVAPDGSSEVVWLCGTHCLQGLPEPACGDALELGVASE
jgi:hypothetical protein